MSDTLSDTLIIALVMIGGTFAILITTILRRGIDDALKLWGVLGPLVLAIVTFYFADKSNTENLARLGNEVSRVEARVIEAQDILARASREPASNEPDAEISFQRSLGDPSDLGDLRVQLDRALDDIQHLRQSTLSGSVAATEKQESVYQPPS